MFALNQCVSQRHLIRLSQRSLDLMLFFRRVRLDGRHRIHGHSARRVFGHCCRFFHGHVSLLSVVIVISISVSRSLEKFQAGVSSRVVVMARHLPQRGMNIGTRFW